MKTIQKIRIMILVLSTIIMFACDNNGELQEDTELQLIFQKLEGVWSLENGGSITIDGLDHSLNYPGFSLSFTKREYQTTNTGTLFFASGVWQWPDETQPNLIMLDDGKEIRIISLTETEFTFSFYKVTRSSAFGLAGDYSIKLLKE